MQQKRPEYCSKSAWQAFLIKAAVSLHQDASSVPMQLGTRKAKAKYAEFV